MYLQQRLDLLVRLGAYISSDNDHWLNIIEKTYRENSWFTPEFIRLAAKNIATEFLQEEKLQTWIKKYNIPDKITDPKNVGVVMAGNIPLVGFHDFLCVFISGHRQTIKTSSRDETLIRHVVQKLTEWENNVLHDVTFAPMLKGCDAYIATGSNNSSLYFNYYFGKYLHIIRRNRTSAAILTGNETMEEISNLADDVYLYYGLGCRNVTKIYIPEHYDFFPLLETFKKYNYLADHNKYRNNYDYQLAILIINKQYYMTNGSIILCEEKSNFSAISRLNYEFYTNHSAVAESLMTDKDIQCIVGRDYIPFGRTQFPSLSDYADRIDTLEFLISL